MRVRTRRTVARHTAVAVMLTVAVVVASLTFTTPAQAAQTVYRTHPCELHDPNHSDTADCNYRDINVTLIKYYDGARYQVCGYNYHHTGEIVPNSWIVFVEWNVAPGQRVNASWNPDILGQPGPGGGLCTPWRAYHADPIITYRTWSVCIVTCTYVGWYWDESLPRG
jgi:hypothetical protein